MVLSGESDADGGAEVELQRHGAVAALASALSERDRYTGDHSESVVDLTARVRYLYGRRQSGLAAV